VGLLAAHAFNFSTIIPVLFQAIVFTLAFVGYAFAYKSLGPRLGKFTVIFFWLGLEYLALKLPWNTKVIYLADSLLLKPDWYNWTVHTGYLGITLWILIANLLFYRALFHTTGFNIYFFMGAILFVGLPILHSFQTETGVITYSHMMQLYGFGAKGALPEKYIQQGELVARTAAWVSVLIILLSFVKNYTRKK
jgi:Isoprenylcysteine carboxyl methyltransferase (ICMT) family